MIGRTLRIIFFILISLSLSPVARCEELLILSPHWDGIKKEFDWGFSEYYQKATGKEVKIRWLDVGGTTDILRYITSRSKTPKMDLGADIIFGGGLDPYLELKRDRLLTHYVPKTIRAGKIPIELGGNRLYDVDGFWSSVMLSGFGIIYNKRLFDRLGVAYPTKFSDLADPRLRGWIGSADPRKSGSIRFIYELIFQYLGWNRGWTTCFGISANSRSFSSHSGQTPKDITSGEIAAGLLIDSYAREVQRKYGSSEIGFVIPQDVPSLFGDGIAILANARNQNLAEQFLEFVLSEYGQNLLTRRVGTSGGPKKFELGKLGVLPQIYEGVEKLDYLEDPFKGAQPKGFQYNFDLASKRWHVLTSLLGTVLVDQSEKLRSLRDRAPDVFDSLPPPMSEDDVMVISESSRWRDAATRDRELGTIRKRSALESSPRPRMMMATISLLLLVAYPMLKIALRAAKRTLAL